MLQGAMDSLEQPVNIPFYTTFWSLQQAFQNPYSAIPLDKWAEVSFLLACLHLACALAAALACSVRLCYMILNL